MGRDRKITIMVLLDKGLKLKWEVRVADLKRWLKWILTGATLVWHFIKRFWSDGC